MGGDPNKDTDPKRTRSTPLIDEAAVRAAMDPVVVHLYPPGRDLGRRTTLDKSEALIGRVPEAEIAIPEEAVSRRHARLYKLDDGWWVEDLGSTNGSWVNDARVEKSPLRDGDLLRFGSAILKFLAGDNVEASYHEEIYRMSIVDALTGVHNKRYFGEFLEREIARALRYATPLSLVMCDVDHFKRVNDEHGHLAGDAVLREIGRRLRSRVRREDCLARYGGEEFAFVLASTARAPALKMAESVRLLVEKEPIAVDGTVTLAITLSFGVAELDPNRGTPDALIARADEHLYAAKHAGRNRVVG